MIKTVKVKKQLRLDELIKYIFNNKIVDKKFSSDIKLEPYHDNKNSVYVHPNGTVSLGLGQTNEITTEDTFTVEVEEEIDYDTVFEEVYRVTKEGEVTYAKNKSIGECLDWKDYQVQIFAMLDGKLELIWEAKD